MKRINFRPIFYSFISLSLGIYFARLIFSLNFYILLALTTSLCVLTYLCIKHRCISRLIIVVSSFVLGLGIFILSCTTFTNANFVDGTYTVSGRINTVTTYSYTQNIVIDNTYIDGKYVNKNMVVSVSGANTMEEGYVVTFTGYVEKTQLFNLGSFNNYYYKYGIAYTSSISDSDIVIDSFKGLTVSEALRKSVKNVMFDNMSTDEASISYASLFGDKTYVGDDVRDNFSISGIAHLLAVSGLHIGFLTSMLMFLLNKTKLKKYINIIIVGLILVFYCYLCDFSVSVIRASIMFLVLSIGGLLGVQYDKLNSLGMAGIVVLLYKPLSVFDAGFLLSFGSVFSIFMFTNMFRHLFEKLHFTGKLSETISVMLSVQLGLLPLTIYYYGQISILTLLANYICIPIFEVFFIMIFALAIIVLIIPPLGVLLKIPSIIIGFIIKVAQVVANQKWAIINLTQFSPFAVVGMYVVLFIISHYVNFGNKAKVVICSTLLVIIGFISFGLTSPINKSKNITILNSYGQCCYILELDGVMFCVGDYNSHLIKETNRYLDNVAYKKADYLLLFNDYLPSKSDNFNFVYNFSYQENDGVLLYNQNYDLNNVKVYGYNISDTLCGVLFEYANFKVLVGNDLTFANLYTINNDVGNIDVVISNTYFDSMDLDVNYFVENGKLYDYNSQNISMNGDWTFDYTDDIINVRSI